MTPISPSVGIFGFKPQFSLFIRIYGIKQRTKLEENRTRTWAGIIFTDGQKDGYGKISNC